MLSKFLSTSCFLLVFTFSNAQTPDFKKILDYYHTQKNFNGIVLLADQGKIQFLQGIGTANRQNGTLITSKSKFKICSITKTFTAVLVMQLLEEGKIDLDATIGKYFPEYKGKGRDKITIKHLLTYSSGLDNLDQRTEEMYALPRSLDEIIRLYCSSKLVNEPGTQFSYKNADYIILGKIIEKINGKPFAEILSEKILTPLGMKNTGMLYQKDILPGLTNGYMMDSLGVFHNDPPYFIENYFASAAMYSTVEDLLKFDQGIFTYQLLKKTTVDRMMTPDPSLYYVGIGFWISPAQFGGLKTQVADRRGSIWGINTNWYHLIEQNKTVIIFSNTDATDLLEMREKFVLASLNLPVELPGYTEAKKEPIENTKAIQGVWSLDLRPDPQAEPYLLDFTIKDVEDKKFSGIFYGSEFQNGQLNTSWGKIYFGFSTSDQSSTYYHSGSIEGDQIQGISYSADRKFISYWTGMKKK